MGRLNGLDGIRGALAVIVALGHAFGHYTGWNSGLWPMTSPGFSVDVFFILSGIVLYEVYHDKIKNSKLSFFNFVTIRTLRLYPMHLLGVILVPLCLYISGGIFYPDWIGNVTVFNLVGDALLMNYINVGFTLVSNQPSWSISIEFFFGVWIAFLSCKIRIFPFLLVIFSLILAFYYGLTPTVPHTRTDLFLLSNDIIRCVFCMSTGIIFHSLIKEHYLFLIKHINTLNIISLFGFTLICITIYAIKLTPVTYFIIATISALSISILANIKITRLTFLDSSFFIMLGKRSFSIYMIHTPVLFLFLNFKNDNNSSNATLATALILLTIFLSGYTVKYIEQPFMNIYHRNKNLAKK